MITKGIIWYASGHRDRAREQLNDIVQRYKMIRIGISQIKNNNSTCIFDNGDEWRIASADDSGRGLRGTVHYIDRGISMYNLDNIIMPTMTAMVFSSYKFYGEGDLHITDGKPIFMPTKCEFKIDEYADRPF